MHMIALQHDSQCILHQMPKSDCHRPSSNRVTRSSDIQWPSECKLAAHCTRRKAMCFFRRERSLIVPNHTHTTYVIYIRAHLSFICVVSRLLSPSGSGAAAHIKLFLAAALHNTYNAARAEHDGRRHCLSLSLSFAAAAGLTESE
jgi:hypothetical protein